MPPKFSSQQSTLIKNRGFTFIEIMVTLMILSVGIIAIYKALFSSLDHMSHLNSRLYANILLEDKIATLERTLRAYKALPFELYPTEAVNVGVKEIQFKPQISIAEVGSFVDIFKVEITYEWNDGQRPIHLSRFAYISDYIYDENIQ